MSMKRYSVSGMTCSACSARVQRAVEKVDGVERADVNLLTNSMTVEGTATDAAVCRAVKKAGYGARPYSDAVEETDKGGLSKKLRLILSFVFLVPLFFLAMGPMMGIPMDGLTNIHWLYVTIQFVLTVPIIVLNFYYFTNGYKSLFKGAPNMNTLIAVGSSVAFLYSVFSYAMVVYHTAVGSSHEVLHEYAHRLYFESAGMILTLISLGKYLEAISKGRTTSAIEKLLRLAPDEATVWRDGQECVVRSDEVLLGETVIVRTGERIPLDGRIVEGRGAIDASAVTGESLPQAAEVGDEVVGGTLLVGGYIEFVVTAVGEDTALRKIARFVEEAASSKAPVSRLADKISGIFVPTVMGIAAIAFVVWMIVTRDLAFSLNIAVSVLVISCPCALGLATPVAIMVGTGKGAEKGILVKNAESLETLHKIDVVVFDKTGTVTEGNPSVVSVVSEDVDRTMTIAYSMEKLSAHPLSAAICAEAERMGLAEKPSEDFAEVAGRGLTGKVDGKVVLVGNDRLLLESGVDLPYRGKGTTVYVAAGGEYLGAIELADRPKDSAKRAVERLREMGVKTVLLTGDNESAAKEVCDQVGIEEYRAGVFPEQKAQYVDGYKRSGGSVAMVGDGINDAPALTVADVGIAIGAGTDVAIESADVVLVKSDPTDVAEAITLGRQTMRIIRQNLFWAFGYNVLGIPIAAGVLYPAIGLLLNPMIAAACMSLSSVTVVTNALRLRKMRSKREKAKKRAAKSERKRAEKK
ncbi:MAG: cadmium-translocating P-type ATPase [Clostridia bacterium]|nr:cadmium-translocating P-type ATPase [Clostridia bacterium]